jgi:hypothetical protein
MDERARPRGAVVAAAVVALALTGCGDAAGDESSTTTEAPSSSTHGGAGRA